MNDHCICDRRGRLLLGLIGSGIQASLTPAMHEREAAEHGVHCLYQLIDLDWLRAARAAGCPTLDGSGMAVQQAVEAFRLFSGLEADRERMRRHFVTMVQSR